MNSQVENLYKKQPQKNYSAKNRPVCPCAPYVAHAARKKNSLRAHSAKIQKHALSAMC